jgi:hypothetical protein
VQGFYEAAIKRLSAYKSYKKNKEKGKKNINTDFIGYHPPGAAPR